MGSATQRAACLMDYYPVFVDIRNKPVLVIGAGNIAYEKILNLLKAGPQLTVIAPEIAPSVARFSHRIRFVKRMVNLESDITQDYALVFVATGDSHLNAQVSQICLQKRIWCNAVDDPRYCHFIVPSILRRGKVTVAISTAGVSPSLAKAIKTKLRQCLGIEYTILSRWLAVFRQEVIQRIPTLSGRMLFWKAFYGQDPLWQIRVGKRSSLTTSTQSLLTQHEQLYRNQDGV